MNKKKKMNSQKININNCLNKNIKVSGIKKLYEIKNIIK